MNKKKLINPDKDCYFKIKLSSSKNNMFNRSTYMFRNTETHSLFYCSYLQCYSYTPSFRVHNFLILLYLHFHHCTPGQALIDWIIKWGFAEDREKSLALATDLVAAAHIQPQVTSKEKTSNKMVQVLDDPKALYKFVSIHIAWSYEA